MTDVNKELEAMSNVSEILESLDEEARSRVLAWAASRLAIRPGQQLSVPLGANELSSTADQPAKPHFDTFAELYNAFGATNEMEKALIAAYWIQIVEENLPWPSLELNKLLKDAGHGIKNITRALSDAMDKKPAYILQIKKSGKTQQSRKTYKITSAGVDYTESKLSPDSLPA